jgi:hypothetical protein
MACSRVAFTVLIWGNCCRCLWEAFDSVFRNLQHFASETCSIYLQEPVVFLFKTLQNLYSITCSLYLQWPVVFIFSNLQRLSSANCSIFFSGTCYLNLQEPVAFIFRKRQRVSSSSCRIYLLEPADFIFWIGDEQNKFYRSTGKFVPDHTESHARSQYSAYQILSTTLLRNWMQICLLVSQTPPRRIWRSGHYTA